MSPILVFSILAVYFSLLLITSYFTSKNVSNANFFMANRQSSWYLVAYGMIGASLSGVTFISVPAWVKESQFSYMAVVFGYVLGYVVIAKVLLPLYYRLNLLSIYTYLTQRFGFWSHQTGTAFFLLSKMLGASARLYLAAVVLQLFLFDALEVPFFVTVAITLGLIWLYTFRGGIQTIVWTDTLQTTFMLAAVVATILVLSQKMDISYLDIPKTIIESDYSQIFFWDWKDSKFFIKQFISGAFITIVMTGLDQDMMQKNLTCKTLADSQKNMFSLSVIIAFVNVIFLSLGAMLYLYAQKNGIDLPLKSDEMYPMLAKDHLGTIVGILFVVGVVAAAYSSADSALTALTTSFCVDILKIDEKPESEQKNLRMKVHVFMTFVMLLVIVLFDIFNESNVIKAVFVLASYTYGPLLGLFTFGLYTSWKVKDRFVPFICIVSPILCFFLDKYSVELLNGYKFGFELLLVNGALTFFGLFILRKKY